MSGYVAVCIFPISFTTTDYTAVATGVMSVADATFGKENYVNNILWDFIGKPGSFSLVASGSSNIEIHSYWLLNSGDIQLSAQALGL